MATNEQAREEQLGQMSGLAAGLITGARIGSVFIRIPLVGTFVGAMLGGVVGSAVGQRVGPPLYRGVSAFLDSLNRPLSDSPAGKAEGSAATAQKVEVERDASSD
jgi:phage tail tape-measure protein